MRLDIILAGLVLDMDAVPLDHDQRALASMLAQIGVGVEVVGDIDAGDRIAARHFLALGWNSGNIGPAARTGQTRAIVLSLGGGPMASKRAQTAIAPKRDELEPIEIASRDEIAALQLDAAEVDAAARLRQRRRLSARNSTPRACIPTICRRLADLAQIPVHHQGGPARQLSVRHVRRAARAGACASTPRPAPPASRPWSAIPQRDHRHLGRPGGALASAPAAAGRRMRAMSPMATASSPAGSARITAPSGSAAPSCRSPGGMTERQVQLIADFEPDIIMATPSYMLAILDEFRASGHRSARAPRCASASSAPSPGPMRCAPRSRKPSTSTPSTSTASPR